MFPKGTVTAAVTPAEKQPVIITGQKESTVVYMVDNTDSQVDAVNHPYWRNQRARICACAVVLTTLILVAGTLGGIVIVLTYTNGVRTTDPQINPSLNHDREPLLSNEVPLPKTPESTIRIKIDDGGLWPPTEPATVPDLTAVDDVAEGITKPLPTIALSTLRIKMGDGGVLPPAEPAIPDDDVISIDDDRDDTTSSSSSDFDFSPSSSVPYGRTYVSSSFPHDGWYARGEEGSPPRDQSSSTYKTYLENTVGETDVETSGDDQEDDNNYGSGDETDLALTTDEPSAPPTTPDRSALYPSISSDSDAYYWSSQISDSSMRSSSSDESFVVSE